MRWLAIAWLLVVVAVACHQWRFWQQSRLDSDILALLPQDADAPDVSAVVRRIADAGARDVVVLLGADSADRAKAAREAYRGELLQDDPAAPLIEAKSFEGWFDAAQAFYAPYRDRLLLPSQRERLDATPASSLSEAALARLYGPMAGPRLLDWHHDPLGLWPEWWQSRAAASGHGIDEDGLLHADGLYWAVLRFETAGSAFRLDGESAIADLLGRAFDAARQVAPDVRELRAGVPLHAEAAAVQASREVNLIGWGSLAAVLLLAWLAFGSPRPILLVALSLLVGCAAALSATALVFGKVHLLTLVFGASLVGVAEDYGIHWFASRQGHPQVDRWRMLRWLFPGLLLALATSALAYLALGIAPFPGLRQMAVFSVTGLAAAFATAILWFPWLDRGGIRTTAFSRRVGASLARWPRVRAGNAWWIAAVVALAFAIGGWSKLRTNDDLRSLQSSPPSLMAQQAEVSRLLGLSSPAQFFLVQGADAQAVLEREEALTARLAGLRETGVIRGWRATSDWLPSIARQQEDVALVARQEAAVMAAVGEATGEALARPAFATGFIEPGAWLASEASLPFRHGWLDGKASVVFIDGLTRENASEALPAQATGLDGVRWVDRTSDYSRLLRHYRGLMQGLLLVGAVLVFAALWWRHRSQAWRAMLPTVLAGILSVALLGWLGQPLQLFNVLALLLLLGMGIDYGIFLLEHRSDPAAWMAVSVGAASTWLSFGLLSLSSTPALRAFGLTMLFGIGLVWLISPLFRPPAGNAGTQTEHME